MRHDFNAEGTMTIVQVDDIVDLGTLGPESLVTPGIYVNRVVAVGERAWLRDGEFVGAASAEGTAS
jgi:3-oxoadipate CoA-transferase alpha subunit